LRPLRRGCILLATVWSVNVVSGIAALQYLSVPMWSTLRRLTTLVTLMAEVLLLSKAHPKEIWGAVGLMAAGALIAGAYDISFDPTGYTLVLVNDLATALYLILVSRLCDNKYLGAQPRRCPAPARGPAPADGAGAPAGARARVGAPAPAGAAARGRAGARAGARSAAAAARATTLTELAPQGRSA